MRGTPLDLEVVSNSGRIIPAYAGNAPPGPDPEVLAPDHPRVCGERVINQRHRPLVGRIIPAYAGNALSRGPRTRRKTDHPRVCGERFRTGWRSQDAVGSSPRMRGTRVPCRGNAAVHRIIPAYAGNACWTPSSPARCADHPRVCGERLRHLVLVALRFGSSPRMRGTLAKAVLMFGEDADHPRVCGERLAQRHRIKRITGSSPRMRGTPHTENGKPVATRIIPAYAGNARRSATTAS